MCAQNHSQSASLLTSVITNRCPKCRRGKLFTNPNPYNFKSTMTMPETCPYCGQRFELEAGFYFGTGYVSYALSVMYLAASFVFWYFFIGISIKDNSIFWWLGINCTMLLVLQPILQRLSRSIWIAFFVRYEPDAEPVG
jgi:uncharacterized protein (DUF983 family)